MVLLISGAIFIRGRNANTPSRTIGEVITVSVSNPSTESPTPVAYTNVAQSDYPVSLSLPTISTGGPISQVGVDQHGAMAVPSNIHSAGWFVNSVKPGQMGLSIIDGHIAIKSADGIFQRLSKLKVGDKYTVTLASGKVQTYQVRQLQTVPTEKAATILYSQQPDISRQLNLITCNGTYVASVKSFDERTIAISALIQ